MRHVQRSDVYVAVGAAVVLASAWFVGSGLRANAGGSYAIAASNDCAHRYDGGDIEDQEGYVSKMEGCLSDEKQRRQRQGFEPRGF